jgi:subtilisin family serine protease
MFSSVPSAAGPGVAAKKNQASSTAQESERRVVVTLAPDPEQSNARTRHDLAEEFDLDAVFAWPLESLDLHCVVFSVNEDREISEVVAALSSDARIESAQAVQEFVQQSSSYDDPHYSLQHGLQILRVESLHGWSTGKGVRVAVVDTRVDASHPDLKDRLAESRRFVRSPDAEQGVHGTAVAGVIAASANNNLGVVGVAPDAELISLAACRELQPGGPGRCDTFSLAKALDFAIAERFQILNLSFAGPTDRLLGRLIRKANLEGMVVVAAIDSTKSDLGFPASMREVIGVSATDLDGSVNEPSSEQQALAAPGVDILTTVPGGGYDFLSGSSFAAAHVSGVAALILQRRPELSPERLQALLRSTGHRPPNTPETTLVDLRRVDPCAALSDLLGEVTCSSPVEHQTSTH